MPCLENDLPSGSDICEMGTLIVSKLNYYLQLRVSGNKVDQP